MKSSLFLLVLLSISVQGFPQKLKVLLIGASHDYSKSVPQDLKGIHKQIREFTPTAFFGEFVSPDDEERLMDYWCKADNTKRLERLKANRHINAEDLANTITSLRSNLHLDQQNGYLKADLAHAYYLSQDVANGHYLYWQVYNSLKQHPDSDLQAYVDSLLSPKLDISGRSMKRLINSEYALIAFPMMRELKIEKLLSMDCQDYDLNWTASAIAFHEAFGGFQKDTVAKDRKNINSILKKRENGFKQYATNESTSQHFTEWLNTDEASNILASGDFFFADLYDLKDFPKEQMLSQIHWWMKRNEGMCKNIIERSTKIGAKRVVVIVGANHRKFMQDLFNEMRGVEVVNIDTSRSAG